MKKILNGKRYNTNTAIEIGSWDNGCHGSDFHMCSETLYKTKNGVYFLHGEGGAASKYAESSSNSSWGSAEIMALSEDGAYNWLEEKGLVDEIEKEFPGRIVDA